MVSNLNNFFLLLYTITSDPHLWMVTLNEKRYGSFKILQKKFGRLLKKFWGRISVTSYVNELTYIFGDNLNKVHSFRICLSTTALWLRSDVIKRDVTYVTVYWIKSPRSAVGLTFPSLVFQLVRLKDPVCSRE